MITSTHNPKIKWVRSLQAGRRARQKEGAFVVEGVRLAEEALASNWPVKLVLHTHDLTVRGQGIVSAFTNRDVPVEAVEEHVLRTASDTDTPQGILVVLSLEVLPLPDRLDFILVVDGVRDPGNMGTIVRTAAAAGVQGLITPPGSVDPFTPKVVRAGMGAHFRLPIQSCSWEQIGGKFAGLRVYLAAAGGGVPYNQADFKSPLALIIGGEAQGASAQARQLATSHVHITMPGGSDSLNVAVAASILMFEVVRQRGGPG